MGDHCLACAIAMKPGDPYLDDVSGGVLHFACCGPELECFVDLETGEPLGRVPEPLIWPAEDEPRRFSDGR